MFAIPSKRIALLVGAGGALFLAGCGGAPPPCVTDLSEIEAARSTARSAETQLEAAEDQRAQLKAQIADEKQRRAQLESRKAELEARMAELER